MFHTCVQQSFEIQPNNTGNSQRKNNIANIKHTFTASVPLLSMRNSTGNSPLLLFCHTIFTVLRNGELFKLILAFGFAICGRQQAMMRRNSTDTILLLFFFHMNCTVLGNGEVLELILIFLVSWFVTTSVLTRRNSTVTSQLLLFFHTAFNGLGNRVV